MAAATLLLISLVGYLGVYFAGELTGRSAQSDQTHFVYLADAMLHGRLDVDYEQTRHLVEVVPYEGKWYVVYPPMMAVVSIPVVALLGTGFPTSLLSIGFAIGAIMLMYAWVRRLGCPIAVAWWCGVLFAFGSGFWYAGVKGSSWQFGHVLGVFFLTAALAESRGRARGLLVGLLLGAAMWSRLPMVLVTPVAAYLVWQRRGELGDAMRPRMHAALTFAGVGVFIVLNAAYNYARFGTTSNLAYRLIPGVLDEPWYDHGILHVAYLPRNLYAALFQPPVLIHEFPWFVPSAFGLSMLILTPAYLLIATVDWKRKLPWLLLLAGLLAMGPGLLHGWPGGTQLGYRFSLDAAPMLIGLVALAMNAKPTGRTRALIVLSVLIGVWGMLFIRPVNVQWIYPVDLEAIGRGG